MLMAAEQRMRSNSSILQETCESGFMKSTENARARKTMERFYRWRPGHL